MARDNQWLEWGLAGIVIGVPLITSTRFFFAATFVQGALFLLFTVALAVVALSRFSLRDLIQPASVRIIAVWFLRLS